MQVLPRLGHPKTAVIEYKYLEVCLVVKTDLETSRRQMNKELDSSQRSVLRILMEHIFHQYNQNGLKTFFFRREFQ